ncbi:MAG: hypothetical protein ACFCVF_03140 [Kineosporiaceae bacterium]
MTFVLAAWAAVQTLAWEVLGHGIANEALPTGHHEVAAVSGVAGGVLVILGAGCLPRSARRSRGHSVVLAVAAALASLLVGAGHMAGGTLPPALSTLALVLLVALVQTAAAALTCVLYRATTHAWRRALAPGPPSTERSPGSAIDVAGRVLAALRRDGAVTSRAPPAVSPA